MVGTLSEIPEGGESCPAGRKNNGKHNVLSNRAVRGGRRPPRRPGGPIRGPIGGAQGRMIILIILNILQSSFLHCTPILITVLTSPQATEPCRGQSAAQRWEPTVRVLQVYNDVPVL